MLKRCVVVRHARVVVPEVAHHVTQRGNNKQDVFLKTVKTGTVGLLKKPLRIPTKLLI